MKETTLGEIANWGSGGTPKRSVPEYFGDGTPWLSIADLNDGIVHDAAESLTPLGIAYSSAKVVPAGTVFIAMYGSIGKLGIAGREMCTSQAIAFAQPHHGVLNNSYLFHFLAAQRPLIQARGRGGTQMNIGQSDLKAWPIRLPSLEEQQRLATILDKVDSIVESRRTGLRSLEELLASLRFRAFQGEL